MERKGEDFLALQEYVTAKATLLERLASMDEKRDKIKKAIFDKIKTDYEGQLRRLVEDFRPVRIRIVQKLSDFEQELAQIEKKLTFAKDKVIELRFRHQLGEYTDDEFRRMEFEHLAQVDNIQAQWDELNLDLEDYKGLIGDDKDFQKRYNFEPEPRIEAPEDTSPEEESAEPAAAEGVESLQDEEVTQPREPIAAREPVAAGREPARRDPRQAAYYPPAAEYAAAEEVEEGEESTETTHETALMDDEELFGRYYTEQETESGEITNVGGYEEPYPNDSGTVEIPADFSPSGLSAEDSSTGVWPNDGLMETTPPGGIPVVPAAGPNKAAGPLLEWNDEEEENDSTMVWGPAGVKEPLAAAPSPKMLVFRDKKNNKDITFPLGPGEITIGRSQENDIVLTEGKISRRHAKVHFADGSFLLQDLDSSNGTFVNGKKISRPVVLHENDEILIGDSSMTFR